MKKFSSCAPSLMTFDQAELFCPCNIVQGLPISYVSLLQLLIMSVRVIHALFAHFNSIAGRYSYSPGSGKALI